MEYYSSKNKCKQKLYSSHRNLYIEENTFKDNPQTINIERGIDYQKEKRKQMQSVMYLLGTCQKLSEPLLLSAGNVILLNMSGKKRDSIM